MADDRLLLEKFVERPRHIEVQIFGDSHGGIVSLFERECTLQRRHQKVIEEAPSAALDDERREALYEAARKAAAAIGYVGAGTVEFVAGGGSAYFIEMNTRLQVEHPVTEMITGLDLVEWQLRVAMGERLPLRQEEIKRRGHAIEARLYAEDPAAGFLPSIGELTHWRMPKEGHGLRIDTGFAQGGKVSQYYDPMLAKVIAHAPTREGALARLKGALAERRDRGRYHQRGLSLAPAWRGGRPKERGRYRIYRARARRLKRQDRGYRRPSPRGGLRGGS